MVAQARQKFNDIRKNQSRHVFTDGNRTAGVRFGDTLRSTRSTSGVHYQTRSILWSESVLQRAAAEGIRTLEVVITAASGTVTTYRAPLAAMLERGTLNGAQRSLPIDAWQVSRRPTQPAETPKQPTNNAQPAAQPGLFAEVTR